MAHIRQLIRDNIVTTVTGLTTTGTNVYKSRVYNLAEPKLPCLLVYTEQEDISYITQSPARTQQRRLIVKIEGYVKGLTGYDDSLDNISAEIEAALYSDLTRGGLAKDTRIQSFNAQYAGDGDQPVAAVVVSVEIIYTTTEGSPVS